MIPTLLHSNDEVPKANNSDVFPGKVPDDADILNDVVITINCNFTETYHYEFSNMQYYKPRWEFTGFYAKAGAIVTVKFPPN